MANSYATFAAQGRRAGWYVIEKVSDSSGVRYEHEEVLQRVFSPAITSNVSYALQQVVENGTGYNAAKLERPAAGKTGTATAVQPNGEQRVSSSWFVGYTPQLSTAVMYVRGDGNNPLDGYLDTFFGADYPTQTWTAYMRQALEGTPIVDFPDPAELRGESPTYVPPSTTYVAPTTTYTPPATTTTSAPLPPTTTTSAPPPPPPPPTTTTSAPPPPPTTTTSAPTVTTPAPSRPAPSPSAAPD